MTSHFFYPRITKFFILIVVDHFIIDILIVFVKLSILKAVCICDRMSKINLSNIIVKTRVGPDIQQCRIIQPDIRQIRQIR